MMTKEKNRRKAKNKDSTRVDIREEKEIQEPKRRSLNESY